MLKRCRACGSPTSMPAWRSRSPTQRISPSRQNEHVTTLMYCSCAMSRLICTGTLEYDEHTARIILEAFWALIAVSFVTVAPLPFSLRCIPCMQLV